MRTKRETTNLVGVWRLKAIRDRLADGRVRPHPDFGRRVDGLLVYTESGHVSVQFMRRGRPFWRNEEDPDGTERAFAARGYGAYAGRFEVDAKRRIVLHRVETALIPNRVGKTLRRSFSIRGGVLTLTPPKFIRDGAAVERSLTWKRVG